MTFLHILYLTKNEVLDRKGNDAGFLFRHLSVFEEKCNQVLSTASLLPSVRLRKLLLSLKSFRPGLLCVDEVSLPLDIFLRGPWLYSLQHPCPKVTVPDLGMQFLSLMPKRSLGPCCEQQTLPSTCQPFQKWLWRINGHIVSWMNRCIRIDNLLVPVDTRRVLQFPSIRFGFPGQLFEVPWISVYQRQGWFVIWRFCFQVNILLVSIVVGRQPRDSLSDDSWWTHLSSRQQSWRCATGVQKDSMFLT